MFIEFIIYPDGKVGNIRVVKKGNPLLDREALRVVRSMPDWTPGEQDGKKVPFSFAIPINFQLN